MVVRGGGRGRGGGGREAEARRDAVVPLGGCGALGRVERGVHGRLVAAVERGRGEGRAQRRERHRRDGEALQQAVQQEARGGGGGGVAGHVREDEHAHARLVHGQDAQGLVDAGPQEGGGVGALLDAVGGDEAAAERDLGHELDGGGGRQHGVRDAEQRAHEADGAQHQQAGEERGEGFGGARGVFPEQEVAGHGGRVELFAARDLCESEAGVRTAYIGMRLSALINASR